jgi:hypothetical protein
VASCRLSPAGRIEGNVRSPRPRRIMAFSNFVLDRTTGFDDALAEGPDALGALAPEDKAA